MNATFSHSDTAHVLSFLAFGIILLFTICMLLFTSIAKTSWFGLVLEYFCFGRADTVDEIEPI